MRKVITFLFLFTAAVEAQPAIQGLANALSNLVTFSPGSLVSVYGTNLMVGTTVPVVTVGTKAAYVFPPPASIPTQLLIELPVDASPGATTLTVTAGGQTSAAASLTLAAYAPAFSAAAGVGAFTDVSGTAISAANPAKPGESLTGYATGLGALNPPVATGATPSGTAATVATVTLAVGLESASVTFSGGSGFVGLYQVNFVVPKDATACSNDVVLTVGGIASPAVTVPIAVTTPIVCAIENSATGSVKDAAHGLAANSFITVYAAGSVTANSAANIFPATSYQGVEVLFNGTPVPLYAVYSLGPGQLLINAMAPSELGTSGTAAVTVKSSTGTSAPYTVELSSADPGVFRLPNPTTGTGIQGAILLAGTYWFAMPSSLAAAYGLTSCSGLAASAPCGQPAAPGDNIVIYLTGGGLATSPAGKPVATGSVAPIDGSVIYQTVLTPTITIGGLAAPVAFSGIAPGTGSEYQINTTIPAGVAASDTVQVVITMGGNSDTVTIAVK